MCERAATLSCWTDERVGEGEAKGPGATMLARRLLRSSRPDRWVTPFRDELLAPSHELLRSLDWPSSMLGAMVQESEPELSLGLRETEEKYQVSLPRPLGSPGEPMALVPIHVHSHHPCPSPSLLI